MLEQLVSTGRVTRRAVVVAGLTAASLLVLAGLSLVWADRNDRAREPAPASPTPTIAATRAAPTSELQQWIDALPAGPPPATPYWHDGVLYANGMQIPAPYAAVDLRAAGDTVLVGGYLSEPDDGPPPQWALLRGDRLEPLPAPDDRWLQLSVDGRIAYWMKREEEGFATFFTWDTSTNTALASRSVRVPHVEILGIDADGNAYLQGLPPLGPVTRWDVRAGTVHPTDLTFDQGQGPELFDGSVPWMHPADAYRSPDGTQTLITDTVPRSTCCDSRLRVRPAGPDDSLDPKDVITLAFSHEFPNEGYLLGYENGYWVWWESNDAVLFPVAGDLHTFLVRCSATGGPCQRVADLGTDTVPAESYFREWSRNWGFARAPGSL